MSELQQVGALDPAAQDKLMADLKQVDPSLWPMVLQTFRAEAAYKRREEQREAEKQKQEACGRKNSAAKYRGQEVGGRGRAGDSFRAEIARRATFARLQALQASNKDEPPDALGAAARARSPTQAPTTARPCRRSRR